jgi:predicted HicB family RNase H-like nuclease
MTHYTYRAEWSPESDEYVGVCMEFPRLSRPAPTAQDAIAGIQQAVDEHVADMVASGAEPPIPLSERHYSGNFMVRTSSALHRRLAIEAAEQGVSLNQWLVQKLAGRPPAPDYFD